MMKIHVNTDNTITGSDALTHTVVDIVTAAFDRYGERITRVEAHLSTDDNSPRETTSLLEARPAGLDPVVVTGSGDNVERACHDAAQKMQSLLESTFGRLDHRHLEATSSPSRR